MSEDAAVLSEKSPSKTTFSTFQEASNALRAHLGSQDRFKGGQFDAYQQRKGLLEAEVIRLASTIEEGNALLELVGQIEGKERYIGIFTRAARRAKSHLELIQLYNVSGRLPRAFEIKQIKAGRLALVRRLVPLSDNLKEAVSDLEYTQPGSPEEKKCMERVLRFCNGDLKKLRLIFSTTEPGSTREAMVLAAYQKELRVLKAIDQMQ